MAGPGAEVLRRLGAIVVTLPVSEIMPALKSGAIDASEWVGPWLDVALGLNKAAGYYYFPGFHEPGSAQAVGINRGLWESFDARPPVNMRAPWQRSTPTTRWRCASCGLKALSKS